MIQKTESATHVRNNVNCTNLLKKIGVPRNVAIILPYLQGCKNITAREIERNTRLRQPEVSLAMSFMEKNSWVSVFLEKQDGKGRPIKRYSLNKSLREVLNYYEAQRRKEFGEVIKTIEELKIMI